MKTSSVKGNFLPFLFFSLFLILTNTFASSSFEIIRPLTKTVMEESQASIVVKIVDPSVTKIRITDSTGQETIQNVVSTRKVYCKSVMLHLGENILIISAFQNGEKLQGETLSLFFKSEIHHDFQEEPFGYKERYFHNDKEEQLCKSCHVMVDKPRKKREALENEQDSACYLCHRTLFKERKGHAPAINWMCTECHTGENGDYTDLTKGKSKYRAPDPIMDRCFSCHENIKSSWFAKKSEHGPVRDGRCNRCHNPHGSNNEFFLRKPIWDLCTTCHSEKASGAHVISSYVRDKSHPTKGKPDPSRPGRELGCSSCHDPHGSEGIFLLRSKGKTAFSICVRCHQK